MSRSGALKDLARGVQAVVQDSPAPYVAPPAGALANLFLSMVLAGFWGRYADDATPWNVAWRSALLVILSMVIVAVTWVAGRARQPVLRFASMFMTTASCVGLWFLTFNGWTFNGVVVYVLVMATCCVCLAAIRLLRGDGSDVRPHPFGEVAARVNELRQVGELRKPKVIDGVVKSRVKMEPGTEFAQLQKAQGAIATLVPTAKQNVRLVPDRERPGEGDLEIVAHDFLEQPPPWPGLSLPGGSIADPIYLAVYGDGRPPPIYLAGDQALRRNAIGLLVIAGQPGAGKTELVLQLAGTVLARRDAELTVVDARKGEQLPAWLQPHTITDMGAAEDFIAGLVDEVPRRAGVLGRAGYKQWAKGCPLPFKVVILDEAAKLIATRNEEEMVELAESIRSVGILIALVMQRVTVDRMPSSVKKARGGSICMGVADDREAARVLSEATMEAGASPGSLGNRRPGCLYLELPGIAEEDWSRMARTYQPPDEEALAAAVAPFAITRKAGPPVERPQAQPAQPAQPAQRRTVVADPVGEDDDEVEPQDPDLDGVDAREPIAVPDRPRIDLSSPPPDRKWTKAALMELLRDMLLEAYWDHGWKRFKVADLVALVDHVGPENLKPPRLSGYLKELCKGPDRILRREDDAGHYVLVPPAETKPARELAHAE